jgi:hypothetical protein
MQQHSCIGWSIWSITAVLFCNPALLDVFSFGYDDFPTELPSTEAQSLLITYLISHYFLCFTQLLLIMKLNSKVVHNTRFLIMCILSP